jgi:hypothetical protein
MAILAWIIGIRAIFGVFGSLTNDNFIDAFLNLLVIGLALPPGWVVFRAITGLDISGKMRTLIVFILCTYMTVYPFFTYGSVLGKSVGNMSKIKSIGVPLPQEVLSNVPKEEQDYALYFERTMYETIHPCTEAMSNHKFNKHTGMAVIYSCQKCSDELRSFSQRATYSEGVNKLLYNAKSELLNFCDYYASRSNDKEFFNNPKPEKIQEIFSVNEKTLYAEAYIERAERILNMPETDIGLYMSKMY